MIASMKLLRWLEVWLFGWLQDVRVEPSEDDLPGGEPVRGIRPLPEELELSMSLPPGRIGSFSLPLPPRIPAEALAMLHRPEPPAETRVAAEPLSGSLRDRMRQAKEQAR